MILAIANDSATNAVLFYSTTFLLIVVLVYVLFHVRKYHSDVIPLNRRLFLPFDKRYPEKIASGEVLFIQGRLSRILQISLLILGFISAIAFCYLIGKFPLNLPFKISEKASDYIFVTSMTLLIVSPQTYPAFKALKQIKRDKIRYFPSPPQNQPYFDYKGSLITPQDIVTWKRIRQRWFLGFIIMWTCLAVGIGITPLAWLFL